MTSLEKYEESLNDDESITHLLSDAEDTHSRLSHPKHARKSRRWLWYFFSIVSLLLTNALTFYLTQLHYPHAPFDCRTSFQCAHMYRQHASIEADRAWDELAPQGMGVFFVSKEDTVHDSINSQRYAYYDAPELGIDGYPVVVEAMHQVHCLNVLRKNLYFNHEFYAARAHEKCPEEDTPHCGIPAAYFEMHIDHYVDFLRHRLMCTTDLGIVPLMWLGREGRTTGDMGRMHMCRNYEKARDFIVKESARLPKEGTVKPKPGDPVIWDYK